MVPTGLFSCCEKRGELENNIFVDYYMCLYYYMCITFYNLKEKYIQFDLAAFKSLPVSKYLIIQYFMYTVKYFVFKHSMIF